MKQCTPFESLLHLLSQERILDCADGTQPSLQVVEAYIHPVATVEINPIKVDGHTKIMTQRDEATKCVFSFCNLLTTETQSRWSLGAATCWQEAKKGIFGRPLEAGMRPKCSHNQRPYHLSPKPLKSCRFLNFNWYITFFMPLLPPFIPQHQLPP